MTVVLFGAVLADEGEPSEWSCFTPHPASASQFRIAPGSHPRVYHIVSVPVENFKTVTMEDTINSITSTSPFRFDIFEPSEFSSRGRCANRGGAIPSDAYRSRCRGREGSHSYSN